jgi:hypothetical protein
MALHDSKLYPRPTMELALDIHADEGWVYATYQGPFALGAARRTFRQILEAVERHKLRKALVDATAVTGAPSTVERYSYGAFVAKEVGALLDRASMEEAPQFAYVMTPPLLDTERFGENVACNRGMHVKAFDNVADAREWLGLRA